jgi:hypothetical protein
MMDTKMFTARLPDDVVTVIDAWAALLARRRAKAPSRADVIEQMVLRLTPPGDLGEEESALRRAHKALVDRSGP